MISGPPPPWSYTRNQRLGLLLLLIIIAGAYGLREFLLTKQEITVYSDTSIIAAAGKLGQISVLADHRSKTEEAEFTFDPNTVTAADLLRLGLSEKQAASFIKYRNISPFRKSSEIEKLYVLRPDQSAKLVALARIPLKGEKVTAEKSIPDPEIQTFPFDPNTIPPDSFRLLGFSERETRIFTKYRGDRLNTFRKPEDLLRITAIDSVRIKALLPVMSIALEPDIFAPASAPEPTSLPAFGPASFDINLAGMEEWQKLPGIGPARAKRIVDFREQLGGFTSLTQLGETYGLPDSTYQDMLPMLTATAVNPSLYINKMDAAELARHPYLNRRTAEIIVRYRENHGPFTSVEELKKVRALTTESLATLLPYLNFAR